MGNTGGSVEKTLLEDLQECGGSSYIELGDFLLGYSPPLKSANPYSEIQADSIRLVANLPNGQTPP